MASETELKYSLTEDEVPAREVLIDALRPLGLTLGGREEVVHQDRYYDDARLSLSRAGFALRRRMAEGRMLATLKTLGAVEGALHRREELELPMPDDAPAGDPWPPEIAERVREVTDVRGLRGAFELTTRRTLFDLLEGERRVAVASFDAVEARRPASNRTVHWNELEIEAVDSADVGGEAALHRAAEGFGAVLTLVPASHTKLERARALLMLGAALDE